jgi:hypothetical protein
VSDNQIFWAFMVGVVALSGVLLWLRDRSRRLKHVPEAENKKSKQRNAVGASAFVSFVFSAVFAYHTLRPGHTVPRIVFGVLAIGLFSAFWASMRRYRGIGNAE